MTDNKCFLTKLPYSSFFPPYLNSSESREVNLQEKLHSISSLHPEVISKIEENLQLNFLPENKAINNVCMANSQEVRDDFKTGFAPIDLLDYMYALLHSPEHREKAEKLSKADSLEIPYPEDSATFWQLVRLGGRIRQQ